MTGANIVPEWMAKAHERSIAEDTELVGSARFIDSESVVRGLRSAARGEVFSIGRVPPPGEGWHYQQSVAEHGELWAAEDSVTVDCHGTRFTHIDGLNHFGVGSWYEDPAASGPTALERWSAGRLVTRALVVDIPEYRQCPWVGVDSPVTADDLTGAIESIGEAPQPGDGVLLYMGRDRFEAAGNTYPGTLAAESGRPGIDSSAARWLVENQVGLLCWDFMDARSVDGREAFSGHKLIWAAGLILVDNCELGAAAAWARRVQRYVGLLVAAPVPYQRITGQAINPLLIF